MSSMLTAKEVVEQSCVIHLVSLSIIEEFFLLIYVRAESSDRHETPQHFDNRFYQFPEQHLSKHLTQESILPMSYFYRIIMKHV